MLSILIARRALSEIKTNSEMNDVVQILDDLLPANDPITQAYCDFQCAMLDIYERENGLMYGADDTINNGRLVSVDTDSLHSAV